MKNLIFPILAQWFKKHLPIFICILPVLVYSQNVFDSHGRPIDTTPNQNTTMFAHKEGNIITTETPLKWKSHGQNYSYTPRLSYADYIFYLQQSKTIHEPNDYAKFASEDSAHQYIFQVLKDLDSISNYKYSGHEFVQFLIDFVQQAIPYNKDPANNRDADYPRFAIETIIRHGGDCEDKAVLLTALLNASNFEAVLVYLPRHMATACWSTDTNSWHYQCKTKDGVRNYIFIETTQSGWKMGEMDTAYRKVDATILFPLPVKIYNRQENYKKLAQPPTQTPSTVYHVPTYTNTSSSGAYSYCSVNGISVSSTGTGVSTVTINGVTTQIQGNSVTVMSGGVIIVNTVSGGNVNNVENNNGNGRPR